ncbi:DUF4377 domain-containing protein [Pseudalgibacter alginicilyticus]|nr:DUF4377 domain-containing protein [Pseudalgibacter alginicilyticus]
MKKTSILLSLLILLNLSCSTNDSDATVSLWVDSERIDCIGEAEQTCYKVQESSIIDEANWHLLYDSIQDFDEQYETGYIYRISVIKINIDNPPADGSSMKYILNRVISKELDE